MVAVRFYSLSNHPNRPCFILKWPEFCVMLDCALDLRPLLNFVPLTLVENERLKNLPQHRVSGEQSQLTTLKDCNNQIFVDGSVEVLPPESEFINFAEIDVILISNYFNMLALPYVTSYPGFKGIVYATDPTLQFGRLLMDELVEYCDKVPKPAADQKWKTPNVVRQFYNLVETNPQQWRPLYSSQDIQNCLSKIKTVSFRETLIVYLTSSSVLTTHPKSIDTTALNDADVLILSNLTQTPNENPDSMLGEFCCAVVSSLKIGGNVLIPLYSTGLLYDLLECLCTHLDNVGLTQVPIYILAHSAESSLAFANIYAEWLADVKQAKVFLPEEPFLHGFLLKNGRLKVYQSSYAGLSAEFKTPCIVFASHPSLRLGDSVHFMELWSGDPKNLVILTEPDFYSPEVLAPFQPLAAKALFCPIDTSLNFTQANKLLEEIKPKSLYIPEPYNKKPVSIHPNDSDSSIVYDGSCICYRKNLLLAIPFRRKFRKLHISPELAVSIDLQKTDKNSSVSQVRGILSIYGNHLQLKEVNKDETDSFPLPLPYGQLDLRELLRELKTAGYDPQLSEKGGSSFINLENEKVSIQINPEETHVSCEYNDETNRKKFRDIVLNCLCKL